MAAVKILEYTIHLPDKAQVEALQAAASRVNWEVNDPNGELRDLPTTGLVAIPAGYLYASPARASLEFDEATLVARDEERPAESPYITSAYIYPVGHAQRGIVNVDRFTLPYWGGGRDVIWRGRYQYTPNEGQLGTGETPATPDTIRHRRWADGFELPGHGEGSAGGETANSLNVSRLASRVPGGLGLRLVDPANGTYKTHTVNEFRALTTTESWERIYINIRTLPTAAFYFWRAQNSGGANNGLELGIMPNGAIAIADVLSTGVRNPLATTQPQDTDTWLRLDILLRTGGHASGASCRLFIRGAEVLNVSGFSGSGFGVSGNHTSSQVGNVASLTGATIGLDLDDWISADYPTNVDDEDTHGPDWLNGSHVTFVRGTAYGPAHQAANWGANKTVNTLGARPVHDIISTVDHVSTTADSILEIDTDIVAAIGRNPNALQGGIVALTVGLYNSVAAAVTNGTLSISRNGGAYADTALTQNTAINWDNAAYLPSGLTAPEVLTALALKYTTGSGVSTKTVRGFAAAAEMIGQFGAEDFPAQNISGGLDAPPAPIIHNAPYPRSPWTYAGAPPISPVKIKAGTYVGNDGTQVLTFPEPVAWLHIRRVDAAIVNSGKWWSSMISAKIGWDQSYSPEAGVEFKYEGDGVTNPGSCTVRIAGNVGNLNATGVTYQYVAFMDPGMRFCLNGVVKHHRGASDRQTALFKPTFQADAAFLTRVSTGGSTNVFSYYKGPGHAAQSLSLLNAAETANAFELLEGAVLIRSAIMAAAGAAGDSETPFALFRRDDGSGDPGIVDALFISSYTGDGAASRTIAMPTTKRPLFALVVPHNGAAIFRDPSHTGTTSSAIATGDTLTANAATGITAGGVGSITVGSALNSNGVVYDVFVILGCESAGNNGWGPTSCDSEPVEAAVPVDWPGEAPPEEGTIEPSEGGGEGGGGTPPGGGNPGGEEFGAQCVSASQKLCNRALGMIGVSKLITDIVNEATVEANLCRLHYDDAVLAVLREHPWPFATKYATLAILEGDVDDPTNDDWTFAYTTPSDCVFPRRVVNPERGREFDPDPPKYREGTIVSAVTGDVHPVIYTHQEDAILEYTFRPGCAAGAGDALFREALMWKMAQLLAPALCRDEKKVDRCAVMYERALNVARNRVERSQQQFPDNGDAEWIRDR